MGILDDALGLAKDPLNRNRVRQQQDGLQSGVYTDKKWWESSPQAAGDSTASDTFARITRDQWADYKTYFAPYEEKLIALSTGNADNLQSEQRAAEAVNTGFKTSMGTLARDRSRLGLSVGADQAADESRLGATIKTASLVDATNKSRLHAQDRDTAVLTGGLSSLKKINGEQR